MKKSIFIVMTLLMIIFVCVLGNNTYDDIWNYGFSYNIAKGAVPYKDFNMVIMPLYSLLMSVPLILFGNKLIVFHLSNTILFSIVLYFTSSEKRIANILLIYITFFVPVALISNYNTFVVLILILVLYIEKSSFKYKEEIIGILLGCILATKQNIGILLFIPYILHSKEKIKSTIYYLIPITLVCVYLIFNNTLFECIDYCFFGLSNFKENFIIQTPITIIMEILVCIYLIFKYRKTKDINYIYILFFQSVNYPLFDLAHFIVGIMPLFYYIDFNKFNKYILLFITGVLIGVLSILCLLKVFDSNNIKNINKKGVYEYTTIDISYLENNKKIINSNKNKRIFIFDYSAYLTKVYMNQKLDKYDLINKGNMGKDENKYIHEIDNICKKKECMFIMDRKKFDKSSQLNSIIKEYVLENYRKCDSNLMNYYCNS